MTRLPLCILILSTDCSSSCPTLNRPVMLVTVVDNAQSSGQTTVFVCDADVTASSGAGTGMTTKSFDGADCAYDIFVRAGTYTVSAAWNGRTAQTSVVVPDDFACGIPKMTTKVQLRL